MGCVSSDAGWQVKGHLHRLRPALTIHIFHPHAALSGTEWTWTLQAMAQATGRSHLYWYQGSSWRLMPRSRPH